MGEQVLGMKTTPGKGYSDRAPSVSWERPQKNFSYIFAAPHAISVPFCGGGGGQHSALQGLSPRTGTVPGLGPLRSFPGGLIHRGGPK